MDKNNLKNELVTAVVVLALFTVLTGVLYPALVTVVAQTVFAQRANGSFVRRNALVVGSELIGQSFSEPGHFWGRLSATPSFPYNAQTSGGSNFGPLHPDLLSAAKGRVSELSANSASPAPKKVPIDLVTASGSGLDPHISPAAAEWQIERVATVRGLPREKVVTIVRQCTLERTWGILGEPRVNVLQLNLALEQLASDHVPHE